jgi:hypothetical protein
MVRAHLPELQPLFELEQEYDKYAARFEATRSRINEVSEQREALIA